MRYLALACDYDGTLAHHGQVDAPTIAALQRLRGSGRRLLMVTGRELDDLMRTFPHVHLFDRIIAENGALFYNPETREAKPLADPPPDGFARELERRGVTPLSVGQVIVATWEPHDPTVLQVIHELGLELQVIFNKGAVMVLPSGVNKATGLRSALEDLGLSAHNTVGVGDAENDHAFLAACECGVAVANALESVKAHVDHVTAADHGAGVVELADRIVESDLADISHRMCRHDLVIGLLDDGREVRVDAYGHALLIAGPSGAGKTTVTMALLERFCERQYQFCVVDPEGDYFEFPHAIALRGADQRALADEALRVLDRPGQNAVVSLMDIPLEERPSLFQRLLPRLLELRASTGRPHWIVVDEAHHLLPPRWQPSQAMLPARLRNVVFITVHPDHVARFALDVVDTLIVAGEEAQITMEAFARGRGESPVQLPVHEDDRKQQWLLRAGDPPVRYRSPEPAAERRRHRRKYAEGELGEDKSFYFRGPDGRLNLRAQNLQLFAQLADGVDDETWRYHLAQKDVSRWFRGVIKDESLADEADEIETQDLSPADSRSRIRAAIHRRYTAPA